MNIKAQIESAQYMIDDYESYQPQTEFAAQRLAHWNNILAELIIKERNQNNREEIIEELEFHESPDSEMTESEKKGVVEIVMAHLNEYENMLRDIILEKFRPENGHILVMGAPGAGKSTQGKHLAEILGIKYISTGDLLRNEVKKETELGKIAAEYQSKGELVPDEIVIKMVEAQLTNIGMSIIDGFPRSEAQVDGYPNFSQVGLFFNLSDELALKRLVGRSTETSGAKRFDDKLETQKHRIDVFHKQTDVVVESYRESNRLITVELDEKMRIWQVWAKMIEAMVSENV